ncbi:hypothetical protein [Staphylococcus equorum]|uniref:Uncharacterized protein n=1 Tax=Staphylococcus equorum TaxID=246432 RepID=A0AAP7IFR7_9STAP|nr:hypothetical protein [Staphylococcus equorum]OEK58815.1 hypothetical protein ASS94_01290 [Staphylococcus equorum]
MELNMLGQSLEDMSGLITILGKGLVVLFTCLFMILIVMIILYFVERTLHSFREGKKLVSYAYLLVTIAVIILEVYGAIGIIQMAYKVITW